MDLEKMLKKDVNRVTQYIMKSKICNSGYLDVVNDMIRNEHTYKEIIDFLAAKGIKVTPAQVSRHKKMLPYIEEVQPKDFDKEMDVAIHEVSKDRYLKRNELTNVELAIETLQKTIQSSQVMAVQTLWGEVIPQMIENIKSKIAEGHRISFKDSIEGLDKIVKIAQLLENKPTVIQQATVNGKTEVKHEHSIESIGDGTAESVSNYALEAILKVNDVLAEYAKSRGEGDVNPIN
ncbi:hypothetical protein [Weizmannia phage Youna2]